MHILTFSGIYELLNLVETYFWKHFSSASSLLFLDQADLQSKIKGCILAKYMVWSDCKLIHYQSI